MEKSTALAIGFSLADKLNVNLDSMSSPAAGKFCFEKMLNGLPA